jgi:DNA-binding NarL/FixJ family response regulator
MTVGGNRAKAICGALDLSEATVKIHVSAILRALKASPAPDRQKPG